MVENIIQTILDHKVVLFTALIATLIGGVAAVHYFYYSWKEYLRKRKMKRKKAVNPVRKPVAALEEPEGTVPLNSPFYVERPPTESDCYKRIIRPAALIRVKAPRQMGKTSLMVRILDHAKDEGALTVPLYFQLADNVVFENLDQFLQWFCSGVAGELGMADELDRRWKGVLGAKGKCTNYFQKYLLAETEEPLVLGMDEVDLVFQYPEIAADFFGMLRAWHEKGKNEETWKRLRMIIVHSKEVYVPMDMKQSPFNVGLPIDLPELSLAQTQDMAGRHGLQWAEEHAGLLRKMVGGHPYLLRVAMCSIALGRMTLEELLKLAPTEQGPYSDHLRRHLLNLEEDEKLLAAMTQVLKGDTPVRIKSTEAFKLRSMGLVKYQGNEVTPLCDLYRKYFQARM